MKHFLAPDTWQPNTEIKNLNLKIPETFTKVEFFTHNSLKMSAKTESF